MTSLFLIVALVLGGLGVYVTYRDPKWGTPILVGVAIITVLYIVWDHDPSGTSTDVQPTSPAVPGQPSPSTQGGLPEHGSPMPSASSSQTAIPTASLFSGK
jgi:hypothetical protein